MPEWTTIGTRTPIAGQWALFPTSTDSELFRLTHQWASDDWWKPRGLIAQVWNGAFLIHPFKIYPRSIPTQILRLPIPPDFKFSGDPLLPTRSIGVYLLSPYKADPVSYQWSLTIDVFPSYTIPQATQEPDWDEIYSATSDDWDGLY